MILHLAEDEKFIDIALRNIEHTLPGKNKLVVFSKLKKLKFIQNSKVDYIINPRMFSPKKLIEKLGHFDLVISYSLFEGSINFINHVSCPVVWLGFGFDYYPLIVDNTNSLFLSKTASLYYNYEKQQNKKLKSKIKKIIKRLFPRSFLQPSSEQILQLIRLGKISFFAPIIKPEYDILKNKLMINNFPEYIDFSFGSGYASDENFYSNIQITGNNILLGNSATFTNNHIEAIDIIAKYIKIKKRKIITPLNYGNEFYKTKILMYGEKVLGSNFEPILDYMDKKEYFLKISSCSVCIMNHLRQQALGNISIMLLCGAKVFLNDKNILYKYLRECGFFVYPIDEICQSGEKAFKDLTLNEKNINRNLVKNLWSKSAVLEKIRKLIEQTGVC
jgi:hypothetical protein